MSTPQQADVVFIRAPPTTTFTNAEDPSSLTYETRTPTSHTRRVDNIFITQPGEPPIVAGWFETMVDAKMEELRAHGMAFVVRSLLTDGVQNAQSTPFVSMVARTMLDRLAKVSTKKMKRFNRTLRTGAMEDFCLHWKSDGDWRNICSTTGQHSILTLTGINKASLLGSLFSADIVTADDIGLCLSILLGHIHFDRLCAIHALLVCADDRLCKNLSALLHLQKMLRIVDPLTGLYMWGPVPHSQALIQNILATIEGWMTVQAHEREQYRPTWQPPSRAAGRRMRGGRMRNRA
ncbi:hypothetical protein CY34DRAFT_98221 [Suillus luteus UH-Slu-Lm8-n1]|uniref:Uncharacterized protein n=1 Tax=Suillus luteus UH-Slu-Lm8-n1 TaxID=930992 RepID=A0A0D0AQQ7_9AGAM|nr:hypothetical protein CY34DRAFT_98221 [Suillus luteus UH-Slu-Lm8-n1]